MKAKIVGGDWNGVEFELSDETVKNLIETNIPKNVRVGQIYEIDKLKYMVAAIGYLPNNWNVGLTNLSENHGCFSSALHAEPLTYTELRKVLIKNKAKYLGNFDNVFQEIKQ